MSILKLTGRLAILYVFILLIDAVIYSHAWSWSLPALKQAPAAYLIFIPGFISLVYVTVKDFRKASGHRNQMQEN